MSDFGTRILAEAEVVRNGSGLMVFRVGHRFDYECFDKDGNLKWTDVGFNTVVNTGLDDILDKYYKGSGYTALHYVGLTDGTPTVAAADTMASHAGWAEVHTQYSEADRQTLTLGSVSSQSASNSASRASFTFTAGVTVGGSFVTTSNSKGTTTGTLIGVAAFSGGDRLLSTNDVLNVTVTVNAATL